MACPICRLAQAAETTMPDMPRIDCPRCGSFRISGTADAVLRKHPPNPRLAAWVRSQHEAGNISSIDSNTIENVPKSAPEYSVQDKHHLLLQWLARRSKFPGDAVQVRPDNDWPITWSFNVEEFSFLLQSAADRGHVRKFDGNGHIVTVLTPHGWDQLDRAAGEMIVEDRAFVAMSFDPSLAPAWLEGLKPGIEAAGYRALRVDSEEHLQRIDLKIIGDIRASRFVVADVTGQRPGVYFEAGFALALGRPVVWSVRRDEVDKIHFDTRQFRHIVWSTPSDLASQIEAAVAGTIGRRRRSS